MIKKLSKRYPPLKSGDPTQIRWRKVDLKMACCDCGLVHRVRFKVKGPYLVFRMWRDTRATGQIRRHRPKEG